MLKLRKTPFVVLLIIFVFICSSCSINSSHDKTVDIDNSFTIEGKTVSDITGTGQIDFVKTYPDAEALYPDSSLIVVGEVGDIQYSDAGGIATTYYDFKITECWDGSCVPDDVITVAHNGGYIRASVFNAMTGTDLLSDDEVILESAYNIPLPKTGEQYILFLTEWNNGTYCAIDSFMARYFIDTDNSISRFIPDDEYCRLIVKDSNDPTTLNAMREYVSQIPELYDFSPLTLEENKEMFINWYGVANEDNVSAASDTSDITIVSNAYQSVIDNIQQSADLVDTHPRVLILGQNTPYQVAGGDTFQSTILTAAGGVNAAADYTNKGNFSLLSIEQIAALNPDYIVIPEAAQYNYDDILTNEKWASLNAVNKGNIIIIPTICTHQIYSLEIEIGRGSPDICIGIAYIHHCIHSDVYSFSEFLNDFMDFSDTIEGIYLIDTAEIISAYSALEEC